MRFLAGAFIVFSMLLNSVFVEAAQKVSIWSDLSNSDRSCAQYTERIHSEKEFENDWTQANCPKGYQYYKNLADMLYCTEEINLYNISEKTWKREYGKNCSKDYKYYKDFVDDKKNKKHREPWKESTCVKSIAIDIVSGTHMVGDENTWEKKNGGHCPKGYQYYKDLFDAKKNADDLRYCIDEIKATEGASNSQTQREREWNRRIKPIRRDSKCRCTKPYAYYYALYQKEKDAESFQFGSTNIKNITCRDIKLEGSTTLCQDLEWQASSIKYNSFLGKYSVRGDEIDVDKLVPFITANPGILNEVESALKLDFDRGMKPTTVTNEAYRKQNKKGEYAGRRIVYVEGSNTGGVNLWLEAIKKSGVDYASFPTMRLVFDSKEKAVANVNKVIQHDKEEKEAQKKAFRESLDQNRAELDELLKTHKYVAKISTGNGLAGCYYVDKIRINNKLVQIQNTDRLLAKHDKYIGLNSGFDMEIALNTSMTKSGRTSAPVTLEIYNKNKKVVYSDSTSNIFKKFKVKE